ncbi:triacylglycerol lipase [Capronia coronata CBS 617.96]|uniref:Carboxylic ester hydrolase n=1 Tax=Capronia coronata CBS 617.96 TaxID=1182541 RepID=W9YT90_9EURO|nr:triacylglycerol lipase [Capronia coronata CBS 617.96]EXJ95768.1 triacylglycerol lipase [Capronia coronata CBS 617.96]
MLSLLSFLLCFLCVSVHGWLISGQNSAPTATTKNGSYVGLFNPTYNQDLFLGIPFAQPPVGDLRFRNPVSLNTTWEGARSATQYSAECYGYGSDDWVLGNPVSEDCLTLNVIRPSGVAADVQLPVAVWIYGGGYFNGGSLDPRYNMSAIIQESVDMGKPFIGVSMNYRLHAFGFSFGTEILKAGVTNIGTRDQRLALHWVQENIEAFGGDPSKVTIWGESAGASSVAVQILAYGGRDDKLFRAGIEESGGSVSFSRYLNASEWDLYYNNITRATNCSSAPDTLACLRQVPIETLSAVFNSSATAQVPGWGPHIDNDLLLESGVKQLREGKFVKVPLLHGTNFDEGTAFGARGINTTEQFIAIVMENGPDNATAQTIAALYPDIPAIGIPATLHGRPPPSQAALGAQYKRAAAYGGDLMQQAPRRFTSQSWASNNVSSWSYHFNVLVNGVPVELGATHFQEVAFVYNNVQGLGYDTAVGVNPFANEPESYNRLANIMSRMWVSFIVDSDPNGNNATSVHWPVYTLDSPQNVVFDTNVTDLLYVEPDYYRAEGIQYIIDRFISVYYR